MKLSTKIGRMELKMKIVEAVEPIAHQMAMPYEEGKISEVYETFFRKLDELLNIKQED